MLKHILTDLGLVSPYDDVNCSADEGDKEAEWHRAVAQLVGVLVGGTIKRPHLSKLNHCRNPHRLVSAQQAKKKTDKEGDDAAISVRQLPVEHQCELREDDDKHEVATEDEEVVDAAVGDGEEGGDDAVDDDANPKCPDHLLLTAVWPNNLEFSLSVWQPPVKATF